MAAEADADALSAAVLPVALALAIDSFIVAVAVAATNPVAVSVAVQSEQVLEPSVASVGPLSNEPSSTISSCCPWEAASLCSFRT